ncbi:MAG: EamA family transporter [Arcobacteraceae bacterium]
MTTCSHKKVLAFNLFISFIFLASNSVLCKLAFVNNGIDAFSFTAVRLFSGAVVLLFLLKLQNHHFIKQKGSAFLGFLLFIYAICFSYSYILIDTGIGALILFGMVQITMIGYTFFKKNITPIKFLGALIAFIGLIVLIFPTQSYKISFKGFLLMAIAGVAWGIYSILGKNVQNPMQTTTQNFIYAALFALLVAIFIQQDFHITVSSFGFAFLSGGVTSGLGYVLWYKVVTKIETSTASIIQLGIPLLSTVGGIIFLKESLTFQFILATIIILSGIAVSSFKKSNQNF